MSKMCYILLLVHSLFGCKHQHITDQNKRCLNISRIYEVKVSPLDSSVYEVVPIDLGRFVLKMNVDVCEVTDEGYELNGTVYFPKPSNGNLVSNESGVVISYSTPVSSEKWQNAVQVGKTDENGTFSIKITGHSRFGLLLEKERMSRMLYVFE